MAKAKDPSKTNHQACLKDDQYALRHGPFSAGRQVFLTDINFMLVNHMVDQ